MFNRKKIKELQELLFAAQIQKQEDNETIRMLKEEKKNAVNELKEISLELKRLQRAAGDKEKQPQVACYVSVFEPADVASLTGISKAHIAEWARRNNVRRYNKGKRTCYDKVDVIEALKTWKR